MVAKAQPVELNVPPEPSAPLEQREPMPVAVPVPVIRSPVDWAAVHARDLVVSGTGGSNLTIQLLDWGVTVAHAVVQADGTWSIPLPHADEGDHIYSAKAIDGNGRTSAQSKLLTLAVIPPPPAEPVPPEQAQPSPRERPRLDVVPPSATEAPDPQPLIHRRGVPWRVLAVVAAVIMLAAATFLFVHSRSQPSAGPAAPPVVVAPAPGYMWSFPPVPAGTEYEILTLANPAAAPMDASIHAGGTLVRSLRVPPRSGTEVALAPALFARAITVNAAGPIAPGSIVTVHGNVRFIHGHTLSSRSEAGKP
jgi:hypothetical protein